MNQANDEGGKQFQVLKVNRYEVEDNAVFLDYQPAVLLKEIDEYSNINFHVRVSMSKNLKQIQEVLNGKHEQFGNLLQKLSNDHEEMQIQLLAYLKSKTPFLKVPDYYQELFLSPLINMAKGQYLQIKQQSCNIISELAHVLDIDAKTQIIDFATGLAKSENQENKIAAIQLLAKLAPEMPQKKREDLFQQEFLDLYQYSSVRVRKEIILELPMLARNTRQEFSDLKIIRNFYIKETKQKVWGIRKACVEIITSLLETTDKCRQELSSVLLNFLKDGNKFVRIAAHKNLPEFIAKYRSKDVPIKLFEAYLSILDLDINNQVSKQYEIIERASYYFPGILQTVGVGKWPQLQVLFNKLLHIRNEDVKQPLAESLFEIGRIIGPEQSKEYLFSALDFLLKEPSDSLKLSAIRNLAKFVEQFQKQTRQNLIDVFLVLQKDPKKWRIRFSIASQLQYLAQIYDPETTFKYIFPISLKLCNDNVSEVRHEAAKQIIHVTNHFKSEQHLYLMAIQSLKGYAMSQKYVQRQTFCIMIASFYEDGEHFQRHFEDISRQLASDIEILVRISLAISIKSITDRHKQANEQLRQIIEQLAKDDEVAQYLMQKLNAAEQKSAVIEESAIENSSSAQLNEVNEE